MARSLADSSPHLKDPKNRRRSLIIAVATSSEVEGIGNAFAILGAPELASRARRAKLRVKSSASPASAAKNAR
jgi:hypothetical protein